MRYFTLIFFLSVGLACTNRNQGKSIRVSDTKTVIDTIELEKLPLLGEGLYDSLIFSTNHISLLISSSNISPSAIISYKGIIFNIAYNEEKKVVYLCTFDTSFITPDHVKIGTSVKEIKMLQNVEISKMQGWGYYIKLESGWYSGFCVDSSCTGRKIINSDKVDWIFKW